MLTHAAPAATPSPARRIMPRSFAAAVAAAAAAWPALSNVLAIESPGWYAVRYTSATGLAVELEGTRTPAVAVARFKQAAATEQVRPITYTDDLLVALPASSYNLLRHPLSPEEQQTCSAFVLDYNILGEDAERVAIAQRIPQSEWSTLAPGQTVLYTEVYTFSERDEYPEGTTSLVTHLGELRAYDEVRGLFYASCNTPFWAGEAGVRACDFDAKS